MQQKDFVGSLEMFQLAGDDDTSLGGYKFTDTSVKQTENGPCKESVLPILLRTNKNNNTDKTIRAETASNCKRDWRTNAFKYGKIQEKDVTTQVSGQS